MNIALGCLGTALMATGFALHGNIVAGLALIGGHLMGIAWGMKIERERKP